jgi:hypothetical protein
MMHSAKEVLHVRDAPEEACRRVDQIMREVFGGYVERISPSDVSCGPGSASGRGARSCGAPWSPHPVARVVVQSRSRLPTTLIDYEKKSDNVNAIVTPLIGVLDVRP